MPVNLPFCTFIACALLGSSESLEGIPNSTSPDGKFELSVESQGNDFYYHVETMNKSTVSDGFKSDFGGAMGLGRCKMTSVLWRPDGNYFILHEISNRHADGFYIVAKTSPGFKALPFNRGEVIKSVKIDLGFTYVSFKRWLPDNRIELIIREWDGLSETDQPIDFILDLTNNLKVLSWKALKPEKM